MRERHNKHSLSTLCGLFGVSRQAYYKHLKVQEKKLYEEEIALQLVNKERIDQPRIGGRKLFHMLKKSLDQHSINLGRDAFFDVLSRNNLLIKKRKRKAVTTWSGHWFRKYPNLIKNMNEPIRPNHIWVSDITYIPTNEGFCYLSLITDAYSHKIVGYYLSESLAAEGSLHALLMALEQWGGNTAELVHHSDRGVQYCCYDYTDTLNAYNIKISMTENGDPYENAIAERVNGILKEEYLFQDYPAFSEAKEAVKKAIDTYNNRRPHSSCENLTPALAHKGQGKLKKLWKNYYKKNSETAPIAKESNLS